MRTPGLALTILCLAVSPPVIASPPSDKAVAESVRLVGRLSQALSRQPSATAVLEAWCGERHFSEKPEVTARLAVRADQAAPDAVRRDLAAKPGERVRYRRVELVCGGRVLSRADNWYLPDRLTPEMNRLLDQTDTPFGKAVKALDFRRRTLSSELMPAPDAVLRNRAVLSTPDGAPFSEVVETYTDEVLAEGPTP